MPTLFNNMMIITSNLLAPRVPSKGSCVADGTSLSFSTDEMLGMSRISIFNFCSD